MKLNYIIIQAGGLGTRLEYLTHNKPKCLVSIIGKPIIFHSFSNFKNAKFIIIADYKRDILKKYLDIFAKDVEYQIVTSEEKGTCAGINKALKLIPEKEEFIITWSDLLFTGKPFTNTIQSTNYIGLSQNFTCRWRFYKNYLSENKSKKYGVAGFFIFKDKNELYNLPERGEFVRFLKKDKIKFRPLKIINTYEVGTLEKYLKIQKV